VHRGPARRGGAAGAGGIVAREGEADDGASSSKEERGDEYLDNIDPDRAPVRPVARPAPRDRNRHNRMAGRCFSEPRARPLDAA